MKALFKEVRAGDISAVTARLDKDPSLVGAVATSPPKKDDGQSLLHVALKTGEFEIAQLLLDRGADVNFVDSSAVNDWNAPVIHDAVSACVWSCRIFRNHAIPGNDAAWQASGSPERLQQALDVLQRMIDLGADVGAADSYGNDVFARFVLEGRKIVSDPLFAETADDLRRVLSILDAAGMDRTRVDPRWGKTATEFVGDGPLAAVLRST